MEIPEYETRKLISAERFSRGLKSLCLELGIENYYYNNAFGVTQIKFKDNSSTTLKNAFKEAGFLMDNTNLY